MAIVSEVQMNDGKEETQVELAEVSVFSDADEKPQAQEQQKKKNEQKPHKAQDIRAVLSLMTEGVLVELHITKPNFTARLTPSDLGIELSAEEEALMKNFQLGAIKLLPDTQFKLLEAAESAARKCLYRNSFEFGRSRFVPANLYEKWQEENAAYQQRFNEVAASVIAEYEKLVAELLESYRAVAERNWRDMLKRKIAKMVEEKRAATSENGRVVVSQKDYEKLVTEHETFVQNYMERIESCIKPVSTIKGRFSYNCELQRIALPSALERDKANADEIRRQNQAKEAELRSHLAELRAKEEKLQAEVWAEREVQEQIANVRLQAEREKARLELEQEKRRTEVAISRIEQQRKIEQAVLDQYRQNAAKVATDFYNSSLREINQRMNKVASDVAASIKKNGRLVGSSSEQLRNLLVELAEFRDFINDQEVSDELDRQIRALRSAMPSTATAIRKGRKDSSGATELVTLTIAPLQRVLTDMQQAADRTLIDLENNVNRFDASEFIFSDSNNSPIELPIDRAASSSNEVTFSSSVAHCDISTDF